MAVDLHIHTTASDGTFSPSEAVQYAAKLNLKVISITDHDTVGGIPEAIEEAKEVGIEVIPGIEMGSDVGGRDIHILGYFIDYKSRWLHNYLETLKLLRLGRAEEMLKKLAEKNIKINLNDTLRFATGGILTRAHVAKAMVEKGYVGSVREAFDKYLGRDRPCYVVKYNYSAADVIQAIKNVGGIPVLAHPGVSKIDETIPQLVAAGLRGIEVISGDHTATQIGRYKKIAKQYRLLITGGSDDHGPQAPGRFLLGTVSVPDRIAQDLKNAKINL